MQLRGKAANEAQTRRAWQEIGSGQTDQFIDDALWHMERNQGANFATAISEARQHAIERRERRVEGSEGTGCALCGGHGAIVWPRYFEPGKYKQLDGVECKSIPRIPGMTTEFAHPHLAQVAVICPCVGGERTWINDDVLDTWSKRKGYRESLGRYETLAEWALADLHWIVNNLVGWDLPEPEKIDCSRLDLHDHRIKRGAHLSDLLALETIIGGRAA
jgi:hypothetical protein